MSAGKPSSTGDSSSPGSMSLVARLVERENMVRALNRVERNKGAAGIDGMSVEELRPYLHEHWPCIKEALLTGRYQPQPVREVEIPKASGGKRQLGIPCVLDRLVQQALHQVLAPLFEPVFSSTSYGFRPGKSAHDALLKARRYQADGRRWVVDMDLANLFDEVNHDILMSKIAKVVEDRQILKLLRIYLRSGVMRGGVATQRVKGTPQGSPLSPLLSNIVLDDLDKELERRGHAFCRYADDCNIYVRSRKAAERVLRSVSRFVEVKLRLRINHEKSAVDRAHRRIFLGYSFTWHRVPRLRVPKESIQRFKSKAKVLFRKGRGRNLGRFIAEDLNPLTRGWITYFKLAERKGFAEELDGWIRRRLRLILWRQWKRRYTRMQRLMKAGLSEKHAVISAFNGRGPWWNAGSPHMNLAFPKKYFDATGLVSMLDELNCQ